MPQAIPAGHDGLIPHLTCDGCAEAIEFYKQAFGAEEISRAPAPDGKRIMHAAMKIDGRPLFLNDDFPEYCGGKAQSPKALGGTPVTIHRYVADCDAAVASAGRGRDGQDAADGHVLGRPLRRGDRSLRPFVVDRDARPRSYAGRDGRGDEGGIRAGVGQAMPDE